MSLLLVNKTEILLNFEETTVGAYINEIMYRKLKRKHTCNKYYEPILSFNTINISWLVVCVLPHINLRRLFNAKSFLYIYIKYMICKLGNHF